MRAYETGGEPVVHMTSNELFKWLVMGKDIPADAFEYTIWRVAVFMLYEEKYGEFKD